jgi:Flp pilus assembly pilin Flp
MKGKLKQLGQGMTEYIIIVALVAVAAITAYGFFGDTIRGQVGALSQEIAGEDGSGSRTAAATSAGDAVGDGAKNKNLSDYTN